VVSVELGKTVFEMTPLPNSAPQFFPFFRCSAVSIKAVKVGTSGGKFRRFRRIFVLDSALGFLCCSGSLDYLFLRWNRASTARVVWTADRIVFSQ